MSALRGFAEEPALAVLMKDMERICNAKGQRTAKVKNLCAVSREDAGKTRDAICVASRRPITLHESAGGVKVTITSLNLFCYRH